MNPTQYWAWLLVLGTMAIAFALAWFLCRGNG